MQRRAQIFDYNEMNEIIERAFRCTKIIRKRYSEEDTPKSLTDFSYFTYYEKNVELTTKWWNGFKPCTYIFTLNGDVAHLRTGSEEYAVFMRSTKEYIPDLRNDETLRKYVGFTDKGSFANVQSGLLWYNEKFDKVQIEKCYLYDLNSAYLSILYKQIPDTRKVIRRNDIVKKGEIGFLFDDRLTLVDNEGLYADIIFKLIETPKRIKDYCLRWYERKQKKVQGAKHQIVDSIGFLQYHNPYVRAYIVESCNRYIMKLMDKKTTVLCNTDAIYSTVPLLLPIGEELGKFKLEVGDIKIDGLNYESSVFGDKHRGKVVGKIYEVRNDRIYEKEEI